MGTQTNLDKMIDTVEKMPDEKAEALSAAPKDDKYKKYSFYDFLELMGIPLYVIEYYCLHYPMPDMEGKNVAQIKETIEEKQYYRYLVQANLFVFTLTAQGYRYWDDIAFLWKEIWDIMYERPEPKQQEKTTLDGIYKEGIKSSKS